MKKIYIKLFIAVFAFVLLTNCEKEETILLAKHVSVPTINESKNTFLSSAEGFRTKSSNNVLSKIDWDNSHPQNFKENIDILYTPLNYNSSLAKTFLASVKIKGEVQYRYITLVYDKNKDNSQSFSGNIIKYDKTGKLQKVYVYDDGNLKESRTAKKSNKTITKGGGGMGCTVADIIEIVNAYGIDALEDYFSCVDLSSQGLEENGDGGSVDTWSIPGINISTPGPTTNNNPGGNSTSSPNSWWEEPDTCPAGQIKDVNGNCIMESVEAIIIDPIMELEYPCQSAIVSHAIGLCSPLTRVVLDVFEANEGTNLIFSTSATITGNGNTFPVARYNASTHTCDIKVKFRESYIETATDLAIARTTIHEALHGVLVYMYEEGKYFLPNGTVDPNFEELFEAYTNYVASNNPVDGQTLAQTQHDYITGLIDDIATTLSAYGSENNYTLSFSYYQKLSWGGLINTDAFKKEYPKYLADGVTYNPEWVTLINTLASEQDNSNSYNDGNGNQITPKGTKPNTNAPCN